MGLVVRPPDYEYSFKSILEIPIKDWGEEEKHRRELASKLELSNLF